jgi:hypothetical protein
MTRCEVCGNEYDKAFTVTPAGGGPRTFDSFECAIHALAPACAHCGLSPPSTSEITLSCPTTQPTTASSRRPLGSHATHVTSHPRSEPGFGRTNSVFSSATSAPSAAAHLRTMSVFAAVIPLAV